MRQQQYIHMKAKLDAHRGQVPKPRNTGGSGRGYYPSNLPNPNAMDTSADQTRAQVAEAEDPPHES